MPMLQLQTLYMLYTTSKAKDKDTAERPYNVSYWHDWYYFWYVCVCVHPDPDGVLLVLPYVCQYQ